MKMKWSEDMLLSNRIVWIIFRLARRRLNKLEMNYYKNWPEKKKLAELNKNSWSTSEMNYTFKKRKKLPLSKKEWKWRKRQPSDKNFNKLKNSKCVSKKSEKQKNNVLKASSKTNLWPSSLKMSVSNR